MASAWIDTDGPVKVSLHEGEREGEREGGIEREGGSQWGRNVDF